MDSARVKQLRQNPFATSIACATDFSEAGQGAFVHALALAAELGGGTRLAILNAADGDAAGERWERFPGVRGVLSRWGLVAADGGRRSVFEALDIVVSKVALSNGDPLKLLAHHLESHPADLLVLGTEGRTGLPRWFQPSFAERLARRSAAMTLFVPREATGLVEETTGRVNLRRVLVPVDHDPDGQVAVHQAIRLSALVETPSVELVLLHVGEDDAMPQLDLPECFDFSSYRELRRGPVAREILAAATASPTDLIIMPTAGHHGLMDALRGSVTEQVVREAPCPVLAIPMLSATAAGAAA